MPAPAPRPWEPDFIRLWQAGASHVAIAEALAIPIGTVKSRAHSLAAQGKIQPRPRGGAYPSLRAREWEVSPPVQRAVQTIDTGAVHGLDTAAVQRLDHLEDQVLALTTLVKSLVERMPVTPV